ncbi:MAG: DDE-type integrase/transposase/recombinase, partial [Bacteriovoracaceae bacterium]|nr:DDE-type integrase/transposase/recombinase [Bacteriovoracaceae bacterium]
QYMVGITKYHPNQLWHIDVTEIKVGINKKFYLQVVIDNYSRYILAYRRTAIFLKTSSQVA